MIIDLNILGAQNVVELAKLGLPAVNITGDNATSQLFTLQDTLDIEQMV